MYIRTLGLLTKENKTWSVGLTVPSEQYSLHTILAHTNLAPITGLCGSNFNSPFCSDQTIDVCVLLGL